MKAAVLAIDFINDIVHPKGKIAKPAERVAQNKTIEHANTVIAHAKEKKWPVIYVKVGFSKDYIECPKNSPVFGAAPQYGALLLNSWGTEFHEELKRSESDTVIIKPRVSCFYATPLEAILRAQAIDTLILSGVSTNMAVEHTARDAHDRDYAVIVVQDACESASQEHHDAALLSLTRIAKLVTSDSLLPAVR